MRDGEGLGLSKHFRFAGRSALLHCNGQRSKRISVRSDRNQNISIFLKWIFKMHFISSQIILICTLCLRLNEIVGHFSRSQVLAVRWRNTENSDSQNTLKCIPQRRQKVDCICSMNPLLHFTQWFKVLLHNIVTCERGATKKPWAHAD